MFKQVAGALCAISLVACSGGQAADEAPETAALVIEEMHVPHSNTYCNLMKADHEFVYDDQETWKFVFITDVMGDPQPATIRINGEDMRFNEESRTADESGLETWRYRSEDGDIAVELQLRETGAGQEYTDYEGTMAIVEPVQTEQIAVKGDCGV